MQCFVYKSLKKADTYLYTSTETDIKTDTKNELSTIPSELLEMLGELTLVLQFDIENRKQAGKQLGREDIETVHQNLKEKGYHLQMPDKDEILKPIFLH